MQEYLFSPIFRDNDRELLVSIRSRMLRGIKGNFKNLYSDILCPLKCGLTHTDSQENLLICPEIKKNVDTTQIKYTYFFEEPWKQKKSHYII